jgi:hypothetical protein
MSFYRAPNKRLIARGQHGRFRRTTLEDVGLAVCEICGKAFVPDYSSLENDAFIDPRDMRDLKARCAQCREAGRVEK